MPVAFTLLWAQAASLGKFKGRLAFLQGWTRSARRSSGWRASHRGRSRPSRRGAVTDVADLRKVLDEDKRLTLIVSLLHRARTGVHDDVVTMFCKRLASIHKKGRIQLETLREVHRAESERLLGMFGDVLDGVREAMSTAVPLAPAYAERHNALAEDDGSAGAEAGAESSDGGAGVHSREAMVERAGRLALEALDQAGGLEVLATAHDAVSAHHGNNYLPLRGSDLLPASATGTT